MTPTFVAVVSIVAVLLLFWRIGRSGDQGDAESQDLDAKVLARLHAAGSNLSKPHQLEFFLYFPTQEQASAVAGALSEKGFTTHVEPAAKRPGWLSFATKLLVPSHQTLVDLRREFTSLAAKHGGEYDGWGTEVVK